jgi:hypothetical protein
MINVMPRGEAIRWADTCTDATFKQSECADPSCAQCVPHSGDRPPQPPKPRPDKVQATPAGLLELRRQLHETLSGEI